MEINRMNMKHQKKSIEIQFYFSNEFHLNRLHHNVLERLEHFEMLPVNYDFFAQFLHVIVEYLDKVNYIVNGNRRNSILFYLKIFFFRHQTESQLKSSDINNQLVTTNGIITEQKINHIESKDVQVSRKKIFFRDRIFLFSSKLFHLLRQ
jgi:hypothetical protein